MTTRKQPMPQAVDRGAAVAAADAGMARAKEQFSRAVLATLRQKPDAVAQVREALAAVDAARHMLRGLHDAALEHAPDAQRCIARRSPVSRPRNRA